MTFVIDTYRTNLFRKALSKIEKNKQTIKKVREKKKLCFNIWNQNLEYC